MCASQRISGFRPSRQLVEHICVELLVPRMDVALGAVCSQKPSRQALRKSIVFATPEVHRQRADGRVRASATIPSCTGQRHRKRWIALRSLREVDVAPFQTEQLILPQAGGYCQEDQCSFSDAEIVDQPLDFSGHQDGWCSAPLRTLTDVM